MDINRMAEVSEGELVNSGEEFIADPLQHKAVGSYDGERSRAVWVHGKRFDPGDELLCREFFLELGKTGMPKRVHCVLLVPSKGFSQCEARKSIIRQGRRTPVVWGVSGHLQLGKQ